MNQHAAAMQAGTEGPAWGHRTELPCGLEFHHVESGTGKPLVLLHGVLGDWRSWDELRPAFAQSFRTIAYSRRYNWPNRNDRPQPDHSALVEAEDLAALLPRWTHLPAVLVGASYGAYTALALAIRQPTLVRALVLAEPPMLSWCRFTERGRRARAAFEDEYRVPGRDAFLVGDDRAAVRQLTGGIVGEQAARQLPDEVMQRRYENLQSIRMLTLSSDEFPFLEPEALAALRMPILLMRGEHTTDVHASVFEAMAERMPQAETRVLEGAGHGLDRDNPAGYLACVMDFLERHGLVER